MVHRHYFVPFFFFFQEAYFFPHHWRQLLELALVLILLTIWILDSLSLAHMVQIRMNSLSVLFWDRSLSSYFFNKLFEFWAYVNSLYHLDWSHSALAFFLIKLSFQEGNLSRHQWRQLLELALLLFLLTTWISDCLCLGRIAEIRMNSLSVFFQDGSSFSIFEGSCLNFELLWILLIIWIAVMVHRQYVTPNFVFQKSYFSPHQ